MAQPQPVREVDEAAASGAGGSLGEEERDSKTCNVTSNPPSSESQECGALSQGPSLTFEHSKEQQETCEQAEGSGAVEVPAYSNEKENVLFKQESSTAAEASALLSKHPSKSDEAPTVQAEAADHSSAHGGVEISADGSQTKPIPPKHTPEDRLPREASLSSLRSKHQEERTKGAAENADSRGTAGSRQSARILQLKAKFERQKQLASASSEGPHAAGCASPEEATGGGVRRRFGSARQASPPPVHSGASQGSPSVHLIRSRFEHLKDRRSPSHGELETPAKSVASRKLAAQTLQQLALVDIAARYGKPYKRKEKAANSDNAQASHAAGQDSDSLAGSQASDKRTVGGDSPAWPTAAIKGEEDVVAAEPESNESGVGGGGERGAEAGQRARCLDTPEKATANAHQETDKADQSSAAESARGDAGAGSPLATICGHPSPAIGKLAAIIAGKAQNYGKPLPRRLLTRQESDLL
ncbi:hypothetical protein Esti_004777 [Eimeria stiedai]